MKPWSAASAYLLLSEGWLQVLRWDSMCRDFKLLHSNFLAWRRTRVGKRLSQRVRVGLAPQSSGPNLRYGNSYLNSDSFLQRSSDPKTDTWIACHLKSSDVILFAYCSITIFHYVENCLVEILGNQFCKSECPEEPSGKRINKNTKRHSGIATAK